MRLDDVKGYDAVLVDPVEVKETSKHVLIGMSAADAFEALSVPPSAGWALVDRQDELRLKSLVIEGANGYRFHRFDRAEVDAYARRFATDHGIAAALGDLKTNIERKLSAARVKPVLSRPEIIVDLYRVRDLPSSLGYSAQA